MDDDATLDRNWRLACRGGHRVGGLAAALAAALYVFAGVSAGFLVVVAAIGALRDRQPAAGRLAPAQPASGSASLIGA